MSRRTLKDILKSKIDHLYGIQFNNKIDEMFSIIYGQNYKSIKQKRDLGSDGIIEIKEVCLACYAPEKYNKRKFEKKVDEDFSKYEEHYMNLGYKWRYITNQKLRGSMVTYIKNKDERVDIWGIDELINYILGLPPSVRRKILSEVFCLSPELIVFDFIEEVIEAILSLKEESPIYSPHYGLPKDTIKKIEKNFEGEDIEIVKRKFNYFYAERVGYLQKVLESFDNDYISNIKMTVLREYQNLDGNLNFKKKFGQLINRFSSKYPKDQEYKNYVELILLYLFEQCLIGVKPEVNK